MAEKSDTDQITENRRLLDIFKEGWNIFELLEDTNLDTNGTEFQVYYPLYGFVRIVYYSTYL